MSYLGAIGFPKVKVEKVLKRLHSHRQHDSCDAVVHGPQEIDCCFRSCCRSHHVVSELTEKENETLLVLTKLVLTLSHAAGES